MTKLLSTKEAAEVLGVAVQTLYNWRFGGVHGPTHIKVGRLTKYDPKDLEAYMRRHTEHRAA